MTLEETLINLGDSPLAKDKQGKVIRTYLNSMLETTGEDAINLSSTGESVLNRIYKVKDMERQTAMLNKVFGTVRDSNNYKNLMVGMALVGVCGFCVMGFRELQSDVPLSGNAVIIINHIVDSITGVVSERLSAPPPPP
jgi:Na+/glutamate symporter